MTKITLFSGNTKQEYPEAHDVSISAAGVLTFYWQTQHGSANTLGYKITTSVPFVVEEDVAVSE